MGQNRTNHCWSRAESPCAWAGIQEDTPPTANHHLNNVSQFIRGWTAPVCKLLDAAFVVKYLNQQWIFPTLILHPSIPWRSLPHTSLLYWGYFHLSLQLCFCLLLFFMYDGCSLLVCCLFLVLLNHTQAMMKECSSTTALRTNWAFLTIMQNITADIKHFANCHCGFISFDVFFCLFFSGWLDAIPRSGFSASSCREGLILFCLCQ